MEIIKEVTSEMLDGFYKDWDLTFEGVIESEAGLYLNFLRQYTEVKDRVYIFKGKLMNEKYGLTGNNRYSDDITIMVVKLEDIGNITEIAVPRFKIGGRWFTDIVDNNARREKEGA